MRKVEPFLTKNDKISTFSYYRGEKEKLNFLIKKSTNLLFSIDCDKSLFSGRNLEDHAPF